METGQQTYVCAYAASASYHFANTRAHTRGDKRARVHCRMIRCSICPPDCVSAVAGRQCTVSLAAHRPSSLDERARARDYHLMCWRSQLPAARPNARPSGGTAAQPRTARKTKAPASLADISAPVRPANSSQIVKCNFVC